MLIRLYLGLGVLIILSYSQTVKVVGYDPQQGLQAFEMDSIRPSERQASIPPCFPPGDSHTSA
jgi:hypothetical protein